MSSRGGRPHVTRVAAAFTSKWDGPFGATRHRFT